MKIVIAGIGKVGEEILRHILKEGHKIITIDSSNDVIERITDDYDVYGISGNVISYDVLSQAGVRGCDIFIAVTDDDETNILSCFLAKKIGAKATIARIRKYDNYAQTNKLKDDFDIDLVINPEKEAANDISNILNFPEAMQVELFANGRLNLMEIYIQEHNKLIGRSIASLHTLSNAKTLICACERGEEVIIPAGDFVFKENDKIYFAANRENAKIFLSTAGVIEDKVKNVMIIGCGTITVYLAESLIRNHCKVKIIEKDLATCKKYASILTKATIIHGDGSNQELLEEEGLANCDALICLTGEDEENIIVSLYANKKKVGKIVAKVNKTSFRSLLETIGGASIISPKDIISNHVVSYLRGNENAKGSNILTLYKLVDNKVEAIEFIAKEKSRVIGKQFKDLKLKDNLLIAAIIRRNGVIVPTGSDMLLPRDHVVIVTLADRALDDLNDILQ